MLLLNMMHSDTLNACAKIDKVEQAYNLISSTRMLAVVYRASCVNAKSQEHHAWYSTPRGSFYMLLKALTVVASSSVKVYLPILL